MPQFYFYSFSGQNFWFLFIFLVFYFICFQSFVLTISEVFKISLKIFRLSCYDNRNTIIFLSFFDFFINLKYIAKDKGFESFYLKIKLCRFL